MTTYKWACRRVVGLDLREVQKDYYVLEDWKKNGRIIIRIICYYMVQRNYSPLKFGL